ncbi:MAG: hypothetical protein D6772_01955 [Bacteroidetes bacterium]|nr:MAG: hypothetical protein D6772_01955 [Bacteroidota bacterium]
MLNVNWNTVVEQGLPGVLRKTKLKALLLAFVSPLLDVYNDFRNYVERTRYDLAMTGQVRVLQFGLNDRFDLDDRRILIKDANEIVNTFMFLESENRPLYLPTFLSGRAVDFLVCVPTELQNQELAIRAFLEKYKLVTKRYRIEYI